MRKVISTILTTAAILFANSLPSLAGKADVIDAQASKSGDTWQISATVKHDDEGWKHYANSFQVLTMEGKVLGTRILFHPHVNEQPFTRSLSGVKIPATIKKIRVRAGDLVHGYGGREAVITLPN
jgi:hypothetical protein